MIPRRRDRRGRGLRGPLSPPDSRLSRSRAEKFDDLILDAVERLEGRWAKALREVEFAVEDVPPPSLLDLVDEGGDPPLGRLLPRQAALPPRIIVYRWPIELRSRGHAREMSELVHDVLVEQVAEMLNLSPRDVDADYGGADD